MNVSKFASNMVTKGLGRKLNASSQPKLPDTKKVDSRDTLNLHKGFKNLNADYDVRKFDRIKSE